MNRTTLTVIASTLSAALLAVPATPAAAQPRSTPSLLQQGMAAALYGRCMPDVLTPDLMQSAAALAAFAPAAVSRLAPAGDEIGQLALMCTQQLHQHRCTEQIVAVAGDLIGAQQPAGKALPPSVNPGAIVGGTIGAVGGWLLGSQVNGTMGTVGMATGAWKGAQIGSNALNAGRMASCMNEQARLDGISGRLAGQVGALSFTNVQALIAANQRARIITPAEAAALNAEATRLASRAEAVLRSIR